MRKSYLLTLLIFIFTHTVKSRPAEHPDECPPVTSDSTTKCTDVNRLCTINITDCYFYSALMYPCAQNDECPHHMECNSIEKKCSFIMHEEEPLYMKIIFYSSILVSLIISVILLRYYYKSQKE